jgi:hypothetical protein
MAECDGEYTVGEHDGIFWDISAILHGAVVEFLGFRIEIVAGTGAVIPMTAQFVQRYAVMGFEHPLECPSSHFWNFLELARGFRHIFPRFPKI